MSRWSARVVGPLATGPTPATPCAPSHFQPDHHIGGILPPSARWPGVYLIGYIVDMPSGDVLKHARQAAGLSQAAGCQGRHVAHHVVGIRAWTEVSDPGNHCPHPTSRRVRPHHHRGESYSATTQLGAAARSRCPTHSADCPCIKRSPPCSCRSTSTGPIVTADSTCETVSSGRGSTRSSSGRARPRMS